jgi:hypothetical protein
MCICVWCHCIVVSLVSRSGFQTSVLSVQRGTILRRSTQLSSLTCKWWVGAHTTHTHTHMHAHTHSLTHTLLHSHSHTRTHAPCSPISALIDSRVAAHQPPGSLRRASLLYWCAPQFWSCSDERATVVWCAHSLLCRTLRLRRTDIYESPNAGHLPHPVGGFPQTSRRTVRV